MLYDGFGSVLGEVDPAGTITGTRKLDVYGAVRSTTGTLSSRHGFVGGLGHPSEDDAGLIYMRARWMDPVTGRFVSEDPAKHRTNWYSYAENSPVVFRDRDGRVSDREVLQSIQCLLDNLSRWSMDDPRTYEVMKEAIRALRAAISNPSLVGRLFGADLTDELMYELGRITAVAKALNQIARAVSIGTRAGLCWNAVKAAYTLLMASFGARGRSMDDFN